MRTREPGVLRVPCGVLIVLTAILISAATTVGAGWLPGGLPICTAAGYQGSLVSVSDEMGGMLMVWQDLRDAQIKIYTQRVDGDGQLLWTTNGVLVGGTPSNHPWICADGAGGGWIVYSGATSGALYARHIGASGIPGSIMEIAGGTIWSYNSLPVCTGDGAGGMILAWVQEVDPPSGDLQVVAQRVSAAGTILWGSQGVLVSTDIAAGAELSLAADEDNHGAFLGWVKAANTGTVQRIKASGALSWNGSTGYGLGLVTPGSRVRVADRDRLSQGCHVMYKWHHYGSGIFDFDALKVMSMDSTTYVFWSVDVESGGGGTGTPAPGDDFMLMGNGGGGAACVWDLVDGGVGQGVFAQSLDYNGDEEWGGGHGLQVSLNEEGNHLPDAAMRLGYWGLSVSWVDDSGADPLLRYATVEYTMGVVIGRGVVPGGNSGTRPCVVLDPTSFSASPLVAWKDERPGGGVTDIYAAGMEVTGQPTHPNLVATRLTPETPYGLAGGSPHSFFVMVKNLGSCASDSFWTTIFPNQATAPEVGDVPPASVHSVHCSPLASYDSVLVEVLVDAPGSAQTWSMWGFADYLGQIEEFGQESDNVIGPVSYEWRAFANLMIARVVLSDPDPYPGDFVNATVTVKNTGTAAASPVWIDYFYNSPSPPPAGSHGDQRHVYFSIGAGDSVVWTTSPITSTEFMRCSGYFRVDTDNIIEEENEADNLSGPHYTDWRIPLEDGWPRIVGANFHSSPAIANLDDDPTTLEVVIGCDDGKLYAFKSGGGNVPGWPVTLGDSIKSSPAVGDIAGDSHNEVVVGCRDGKLYAYDYTGAKLWEYATAGAVNTTPALAELDTDDKLEIVFSSGGSLYALEGNGSAFPGSWPYSAGPGGIFTSPAIGNVDGAGALEIAVIAHGYTKPVQSKVFLLKPNGTLYSGSWPATIDTVVVADPVLGDVVSPDTDLEIVSGGLDGKVYVWNKNAALWPSPPRVDGVIETSPALHNLDRDEQLEIVVTSRKYMSPLPPHWDGFVTAINNTGSVLWTRSPGDWSFGSVAMPAAIIAGRTLGDIIVGSPEHYLQGYDNTGDPNYGFPLDARKAIFTSAAVGNIDDDAWLELVVAGGDSIRVWELCSAGYPLDNLWWPMFRHDRARTGCYGFDVPTGVDDAEAAAPSANAIRAIYPNPFNPTARIAFDVSARSRVELAIYDVSGRRVAVLVDRELEAGRYEAVWNGRDREGRMASSGVYFCRFDAAGVAETKKLVLVR